jgi:hypothetical protein
VSSWWWKGSGVIVVVSGGGSGVIIVVIVARSGTTSRISAYFEDIIWMLYPQRVKPPKAGQHYHIGHCNSPEALSSTDIASLRGMDDAPRLYPEWMTHDAIFTSDAQS